MRITYIFDPLCGWCYGAGPAIEKLASLDDIILEFAPSGLFAGENARSLDPAFAAYAWQNDQRIARLTGQPFSDAYRNLILGAPGAMLDSAPATLGLAAAGLTSPGSELTVLKALQHARYVDGRNNAILPVVADILAEAGFREAAVRVRSPDAELLGTYRGRINTARADMARLGVGGVPALVADEGGGTRLLRSSALFDGPEALAQELRAA